MRKRAAQAHKRYKMGSLVRGGYPKNHDLQHLASQGVEPPKRYTNQSSIKKNPASRSATIIRPINKCVHGNPNHKGS